MTLSGYRAKHSPSCAMSHGHEQLQLPRSMSQNQMLSFLFLRFLAKSLSVCHDFFFPLGPTLMLSLEMFVWILSEKVTDELPRRPEDLLTDGIDFSPLSNLLI